MSPTVHIVPHTHWDREWYRPAAQFQLRLAHLVDGALTLVKKGSLPSFLLDGQGIVLDDYAAARPAGVTELAKQLAAGRIESGPWYVLADNLLVSAEAMVRNLIEGGRAVRRSGGKPMRVGYAPDTFGHPAILPTILAGFGIRNAVTWRGFGGGGGDGGEPDQAKDLYRWLGPDGSEVVMIHLPPQGYENGANLPTEPAAAKALWSSLRAMMEMRASSPHWLVMNGADHHVAQGDLMTAVKRLEALAPDCRFVVGSFSAYARAVESWAARHAREIATIRGELREGRRHAWSLQGTHSARLYLKQANTACQRLLERVAEPLVALSARTRRRADAQSDAGLREDLRLAWRTLLENHPHDSICGTSGDDVHREMMTRFERCRAMAEEIVERAVDAAIGFDPNAARAAGRAAWRPALLVFNPSPRARGEVVVADVALFEADVKVGQQGATTKPGARRRRDVALVGAGGAALPLQELSREEGYDRLESPRYYPDCDAVEWRRVAIALEDLPPLGLRALSVVERAVRPSARPPVRSVLVSDFGLENERVAAHVAPDGTVTLTDKATGRSTRGLGAIESMVDEGDSYTSSPRGPDLTAAPDAVAVRIIHGGPLRGQLEVVRRWVAAAIEVTTRVQLDAGAGHVVLSFAFENAHGNRRVRAAFPLGEDLVRVVADGPFGAVERPVVGPLRRPGDLEAPDPCAPMQRYVSVAGLAGALTVLSDGLPQYEARPEGTVLVTLLRAFDQMSRSDIPERRGHAGWPTPTPEARTLGPVRGRLAVMLHGPAAIDSRELLEAAAEAFLTPPVALMRRALLAAPREVRGPALSGDGLVFSAMKPAESGRGTILRCYNGREKAVRGAWRAGWPVKSATLCRLDETPVKKLRVERGGTIRFDAPPRGVVTILLR